MYTNTTKKGYTKGKHNYGWLEIGFSPFWSLRFFFGIGWVEENGGADLVGDAWLYGLDSVDEVWLVLI